ncbi:hypothetical protein [Paracidovorax valerianellae]|nr:hypothetical protein [Paracidovorax valerianellae]MDA8447876.1 hypothetical protein [Paracidovorax valerianellae]
MEKFEGVLTTLGSAKVLQHAHQYSVIEIGGRIIQNKFIANGLQNYLVDALKSHKPVTLWVRGKLIVGVKISEDQLYLSKYKLSGSDWAMLFMSIPLMIILIGFVLAAFQIGKIFASSFANSDIKKIPGDRKVFIEAVA